MTLEWLTFQRGFSFLVVASIAQAQTSPPTDPPPERDLGRPTILYAVKETPPDDAIDDAEPGAVETDRQLNELLRTRTRRRDDFLHRQHIGTHPSRRHHGFYGGGYPHYVYESFWMIEDAYIAGRLDERRALREDFNIRDMQTRTERLLSAHEKALRSGAALLRQGDYQRAVVALSLAAELNQGDPACRVKLAQARMANGHYQEAAAALRRALQLQPKLAYLDLDLEDGYPRNDEFDRQIDALSNHVRNGESMDASFLLGFMEFQRGRYDAAHTAFRKAAKLGCKDDALKAFLSITKPVVAAQP